MDLRAHLRLGLVALAIACAATPSVASEVRANARPRGAGIQVHDAAETLRDFCVSEDGVLYFQIPGGARYELVTSTSDPAIGNPGDGAFHAYERDEVLSALDGVRFPMRGVSAEVFILPYPRRASLESAAGPGLILLSPGVRKLSRQHQHAEFVHELGHVIQYAVMPDADEQAWARYMQLRGLDARYQAGAVHAQRPHEVWAEDFRALFGGAVATSNGTIENADLAYPTQVAGLEGFMQDVAAAAEARVAASLLAQPLGRGAVSFSRVGHFVAALDVFDAQGRVLATVEPVQHESSTEWHWDGLSRDGGALGSQIVFARVRAAEGGSVRVIVVR